MTEKRGSQCLMAPRDLSRMRFLRSSLSCTGMACVSELHNRQRQRVLKSHLHRQCSSPAPRECSNECGTVQPRDLGNEQLCEHRAHLLVWQVGVHDEVRPVRLDHCGGSRGAEDVRQVRADLQDEQGRLSCEACIRLQTFALHWQQAQAPAMGSAAASQGTLTCYAPAVAGQGVQDMFSMCGGHEQLPCSCAACRQVNGWHLVTLRADMDAKKGAPVYSRHPPMVPTSPASPFTLSPATPRLSCRCACGLVWGTMGQQQDIQRLHPPCMVVQALGVGAEAHLT